MSTTQAQTPAQPQSEQQSQTASGVPLSKEAACSSSSSSKQLSTQESKLYGNIKSLLEQQLSTVDSLFSRISNSHFSQLDSLLSQDPLFSWSIRPLSLYPEVFTKSGLDYERGEVVDLFRQIKEKLLNDVQSENVQKNITQSENKLAVRMSQKTKDANDNDIENETAMFFEFEPGTDKIVKGVQFFDSSEFTPSSPFSSLWEWLTEIGLIASTLAQAKRTGSKIRL